MDMDRVRIADVITTEYSDFLSFCSASGKIFISELTNVDFVAFRTSSGQSRDYIKSIRAIHLLVLLEPIPILLNNNFYLNLTSGYPSIMFP